MIAFRPNKEWIENLQVGDMAIDVFGNISKVVEISFRGKDLNGREYVGYYTAHGVGTGSKISHSAKEGEIIPTLPLTSKYHRIDNVPGEIVTGTIYEPTEGEWVEQLWNENKRERS